MADGPPRQGWKVPQRGPAIVAGGLLVLIALLLTIAGRFYQHALRPSRTQPVHTFPAPGIETAVHDGVSDPERPDPIRPRDPAIEAAKRAVVAEGLAGWSR